MSQVLLSLSIPIYFFLPYANSGWKCVQLLQLHCPVPHGGAACISNHSLHCHEWYYQWYRPHFSQLPIGPVFGRKQGVRPDFGWPINALLIAM